MKCNLWFKESVISAKTHKWEGKGRNGYVKGKGRVIWVVWWIVWSVWVNCGFNLGQVHSSKVSPLCALHSLFKKALCVAFELAFWILAPSYHFRKCANLLFLTKGVIFVWSLCLPYPQATFPPSYPWGMWGPLGIPLHIKMRKTSEMTKIPLVACSASY